MNKFTKAAYLLAACFLAANALAQTAPTQEHGPNAGQPWTGSYVPGATEFMDWFAKKLDYINPWLTNARAPDKTVFIGSAGANPVGLTIASNFTKILATKNIGLYQHANGNAIVYSAGLLSQMWSVWAGTGVTSTGQGQSVGEVGGLTEVGFVGPNADSSYGIYLNYFGGAYPNEVNMNIITGSGDGSGTYTASSSDAIPGTVYTGYITSADLLDMKSAIRQANTFGAKNVAIFMSPNGGGEDLDDPFATSNFWANARAAAIYGGGFALDVPPGYFLARTAQYQNFIVQMVKWGVAQGLRVSFTVSPYAALNDAYGHSGGCGFDPAFLENTSSVVSFLRVNNIMPTQWIVEAYGPVLPATTSPVYAGCGTENDIATDTTAESLNAVALYLSYATVASKPGTAPAGSNSIADAGLQSSPTLVPFVNDAVLPQTIVRVGNLGSLAFENTNDAQIYGPQSTIGLPTPVGFVNTQNLQSVGNTNIAGGLFNIPALPTVAGGTNQVWIDGNVLRIGVTGGAGGAEALVDTSNLQAIGALRFGGQSYVIGLSGNLLPTCATGLLSGQVCLGTGGGSVPLMKMP